MKAIKSTAIRLRKQGKSYHEISQRLNIAKSTLATWFKGAPWSEVIKQRLLILAREQARKRMRILSHRARRERRKLYEEKKLYAKNTFTDFSNNKLFSLGLVIYWGEGDHNLNNGMIRVSNTDPLMLRLFTTFLQHYFRTIRHKIRAYLILYPDLDDNRCRTYWSKTVSIPLSQFTGSHYIKGNHPTKRLSHGICTVMIHDRAHKEVMIAWLKCIRQEARHMRV